MINIVFFRVCVLSLINRRLILPFFISLLLLNTAFAYDKFERKKKELEEMQSQFQWWPTDSRPAPVKDEIRGGYWWWPDKPGKIMPWGNRGYIYVYKIIYDYKEEELPPAESKELRPSLLIKKIIKNVKIFFDYNKADLRPDALEILKSAAYSLKKNPESSILITGNCDIRGSEAYNEKLGRRRAEVVRSFMLDNEITEDRIKIISRGKLDAVAPLADLVGMQKDRNAHFVVAEAEEIMIPAPEVNKTEETKPAENSDYIVEKQEDIESEIKVTEKEYIIQKGDSLWKIAVKELGSGHRWKYLYELNKDKIKNPNKLKSGQKIIIPIE